MTVCGPVERVDLGFTSMHEHILVDLADCYRERFRKALPGDSQFPDGPFSLERRSELRHAMLLSSDNLRLDDEEAAADEVEAFRSAGGSAMVETGAPGIRTWEDVVVFRRISERTGIHIVACTGLYAEDSWPKQFRGLTEVEYAQYLFDEMRDGIGESGILPGQIKVAYEGRSRDADVYLQAAARVSRETGMSLQIHVGLTLTIEEMRDSFLPLLYESDCIPERTLICHVENWLGSLQLMQLVKDPRSIPRDLTLHRQVIGRGFNICFTLFGAEWDTEGLGVAHRPDWFYMAGMLPLIEEGYAGQLLMGHDVFTKSATRQGGGEGFTRIPRFVVPALRRCGVSDDDLNQITVANPARLLAF